MLNRYAMEPLNPCSHAQQLCAFIGLHTGRSPKMNKAQPAIDPEERGLEKEIRIMKNHIR